MGCFGKSDTAITPTNVPPSGPVREVEVPVTITRTEDIIPCCGECIRIGVPVMSRRLAIACCILNFFIPGVGTIVAGFSWCCCSTIEGLRCRDRCNLCCKGYCYGFFQAAVSAFVFGWVWSAVWGILFIVVSEKYYKKKEDRQIRENRIFVIPITQQPTSTYGQQPVYQQPAPQQPAYQQPAYQQPAYQQPAFQQSVYQQPASQQPAYQQPAFQQPVYQMH